METKMIYDPHVEYNGNFSEEEWEVFSTDDRTLKIAADIRSIINEPNKMAVVQNETLCEMSFDVSAKIDFPAPVLQMRWSSWRASIALARLVHGRYETLDDVTRFYKSYMDNEAMYPPNIDFVEDDRGRWQPVLKSKQTEESEF
jgi:hypothetical protein